jgi:hypothetical protein
LFKLVLVASAGLWIPDDPIPDIFSFLPHEFAQYLFHDKAMGEAMLTGGLNLKDPAALMEFFIGNTKRMGMAGKILFPIPNRRLSKPLVGYRSLRKTQNSMRRRSTAPSHRREIQHSRASPRCCVPWGCS